MPEYGALRDAVAVQPRVRGERRVDVPRHVDLWHHVDEPLARVGDDRRVLALREVPAFPPADRGATAVARETGPGADREAPALIVRQVEVEPVELVEAHEVDQPLDVVHAEEVPRHVEHRPAPGEARPVVDRAARESPRPGSTGVCFDRRRQELTKGLCAPEEPGRATGGDRCRSAVDDEPVPLVTERPVAGREREDDVAIRRGTRAGHDGEAEAGRGPEARGQQLSHPSGVARARANDDARGGLERERPTLRGLRQRLRDHRREARRLPSTPLGRLTRSSNWPPAWPGA